MGYYQYVVALGDAFNGGVQLYGPFDDAGSAEDWVRSTISRRDWTIVELCEPDAE